MLKHQLFFSGYNISLIFDVLRLSMKQFLLFIVLMPLMSKLKAQDPHFSQFFASPLTLNPAFTGKFDGNLRVAGNYRNQWPTINKAFDTKTVAVDFPIMKSHIDPNDTWGLGIMGYTDKSAGGAVNFNYLSISTAFHKGLDEEGYNQIGAAFQGTYSNMNINTQNLKFGDQLTPFGFTGTTTEIFDNTTLANSYFDLNAGLLFNGSSNDRNNYYVGVSIYHINRPKQQFTGTFFTLNPRTTFHAGGYFPAGYNSTVHLSMLHSSQAGAKETVIGGAMQFTVADNGDKPTSLYAGSWLRMNDAIIPYVGLEFGNYRLGVSYDATISNLKAAAQSRGGFELSLIYIAKPAESTGIRCPKF